MENLLSCWPNIATVLKRAKSILLLADYDGTLTPIVDRPEYATLPSDIKQVIQQLSVLPNCRVGIISGRSLTNIISKVNLNSVVYAGNHGMEIRELSGIVTVDPEVKKAQPIIEDLYCKLALNLRGIKGMRVENKALSLSIHYRLIDKDKLQMVTSIFEQTVNDAEKSGAVRITYGKEVFEVRPAVDIDKGVAVKKLIDKYRKETRREASELLPIYLGDDQTDEDGFRAIEEYGNGISIFVGIPPLQSAARYFLSWPNEVNKFLSMLYEQLRAG